MKQMQRLCGAVLAIGAVLIMPVHAQGADYSFTTEAPADYYPSSSYEDVYGSRYNYGGPNIVDFQIPELEYGTFSSTQTGIMEKARLPGLQETVAVGSGSGYGYGVGDGLPVYTDIPGLNDVPVVEQVAYTSVKGMERSDGSIGTLKIPSLGINMKVWEGETTESMRKGLGHYSSTSAWDGNVGICGHNRGAKYVIGDIKDMDSGDLITYTTIYGTRTYAVTSVKIIASDDWSNLQATSDNRITLTTCLANHPKKRICVQAVQIFG